VQPSVSGSVYALIKPAGPHLASVNPHPLSTGSISVTLTGSGFQTGAVATEVYNGSGINLTTTSVTSTQITATIWQGPISPVWFYVTNPGSMASNAIQVNVGSGSGAQHYALTVVSGSGGGSYAAGTTIPISANTVAGMTFAFWSGATVVNPNASSTTLTMPAAATTVTANYSSNAQVPFPVTTHPRLWVTQADLPRLQSWATASNPVYAQGMSPMLSKVLSDYNTLFFPNGQQNSNYPDDGDFNGYSSNNSEDYAVVLAFNSLIDPNPANRITYAQDARNLLMVAMNQAAQGMLAGAPFRDPLFCQSNRANSCGEDWALTVDWIYNAKDASGNPILTAADKATIRKVFMLWCNTLLTADATGGDHPEPVGAMNSLSLIGNGTAAYRFANNNYYLGHARMMTMCALAFDPSDDPPVNAALSSGTLGNTLRSYLNDANGAWLYQEYAMMGDPATVAKDYGIVGSGVGLGLASGGTPPEGVLYGHSFGYLFGQLLALQTAGFNDVGYTGPQAHLLSAPFLGRFVQSTLSAITPTSHVPAGSTWMGPVYQWVTSGDTLRTWVTPEQLKPYALLALLEQHQGVSTDTNAARWFTANVPQGGLLYNMSWPFSWGTVQSILGYMLLDPTATPAVDPRPNFPLVFFDQPQGQIYAHTDWSTNPTWFDYRARWESINHQQADAGQFELFRNGEWLTRGLSNYDGNGFGQTIVYHNTLGIQNWCQQGTPNLQWYEVPTWSLGSQYWLGLNNGDPTTAMSSGSGYVYADTDMTNLYNRPEIFIPAAAALDVTQAHRSILWLNRDYVVVYDRATTIHSGLFKTFQLCLQNQPFTAGNVTAETMPDGQQLFMQTLLPANPSITSVNATATLQGISDLEPMQYVVTVQDPTTPLDARFFHVIQGADAGAPMVPATYVKSVSGTPFDGAVFGATAVFFPVNLGPVVTTSFKVPFNSGTIIVCGLQPNATYSASVSAGVLTLNPSGTGTTADNAGLLVVKF